MSLKRFKLSLERSTNDDFWRLFFRSTPIFCHFYLDLRALSVGRGAFILMYSFAFSGFGFSRLAASFPWFVGDSLERGLNLVDWQNATVARGDAMLKTRAEPSRGERRVASYYELRELEWRIVDCGPSVRYLIHQCSFDLLLLELRWSNTWWEEVFGGTRKKITSWIASLNERAWCGLVREFLNLFFPPS